jgi:hypothetical protein
VALLKSSQGSSQSIQESNDQKKTMITCQATGEWNKGMYEYRWCHRNQLQERRVCRTSCMVTEATTQNKVAMHHDHDGSTTHMCMDEGSLPQTWPHIPGMSGSQQGNELTGAHAQGLMFEN